MNISNNYLIIAAGGSGTRAKNLIPKQFLELNGKPIIIWTLEAFKQFVEIKNIIIVISKAHDNYWNEIVKYYPEYSNCKLAQAGPTRFHSVKSGLKLIPKNTIVAIHDAARPLVKSSTIENCFTTAINRGNAIPVISINDSVRQKKGINNKVIDRSELRLVQTPQIFKSDIVKKAYELPYNELYTDDASVVEYDGEKINLTEGNPENFKITNPLDLSIAGFILSSFYPSIDME